MSLQDFVKTSKEWLDEEGNLGTRYILNQAYIGVLRRMAPLFEEGTNIFKRDWDLLIVLDACRVDEMEEVADEYSFLNNPGTHRSTASTSGEWMRTTFTSEYTDEIRDCVYVTANPHSEEVESEPFLDFEDIYNYGWESESGTFPAKTVTDIAIEKGREHAASL